MNSSTPTTRQPEQPLDGFETALLQELRGVVQDRAEAAPAATTIQAGPSRTSRPARTRRWAIPVGIAAAGAAALAIVQPFSGATPAFAVEDQGGAVTIEINRLESPKSLEEALAEHGITAAVDYPETGTMCSPDRFVPAATSGSGSVSVSSGNVPGDEPSEEGDPTASVFQITVDPSDYAGKTLVLESTWFGEQAWTVAVATAQGEVGPCNPVPADTDPPEQFGPGTAPSDSNTQGGSGSGATP